MSLPPGRSRYFWNVRAGHSPDPRSEAMNTSPLTTCLWFDGNAEEAAHYYVSVFKDGQLGRTTRWPEGGPGTPGQAVTVEFSVRGNNFVGLNGGPLFTFNESVSFQVFCDDQEEVDYYWHALSEGGQESQCGWVKDRFGVSWQVVPAELPSLIGDPDPQK